MSVFGFPGIGGSLGTCAICGKSFLIEILLEKRIQSFYIGGCKQQLFGHDKCMDKYHGKDMGLLPAGSPIRQAYEQQGQSQ
jgi:hypothetical protein